jgi:predicted dehydrogenase
MGIRVDTYCDVSLAAAERRLQQYGGRRATAHAGEVFEDPAIDAVLICTRHDSHADLAVAAAKAGKHVFIEKPLALNEKECLRIVEAEGRFGVKIMVGHSKRYTPAVRALAEMRGRAQAIVVENTEPAWDAGDSWPTDPVQGGGQAFLCGIHSADSLLFLAASEPATIYAIGGPVTNSGPSAINRAYAVIDFENGMKAVFLSGDVGGGDFLSKFSIQFYTGKGCAVAHNRLKDLEVTDIPELKPVHASDENFSGVMRDFVSCLIENMPSPIPPREGLKSTRLIERIIESIRRGQPVRWSRSAE